MKTKYILAIRSNLSKGMVAEYLRQFKGLETVITQFNTPEEAEEYANEQFNEDINFKRELMVIPFQVFE